MVADEKRKVAIKGAFTESSSSVADPMRWNNCEPTIAGEDSGRVYGYLHK